MSAEAPIEFAKALEGGQILDPGTAVAAVQTVAMWLWQFEPDPEQVMWTLPASLGAVAVRRGIRITPDREHDTAGS
jgi:hypothetical protein